MSESTTQARANVIVDKLDNLIENTIKRAEMMLKCVAEGCSIEDVQKVSDLTRSIERLIDARADHVSYMSYEPRIELLRTRVSILENKESK